MNSIIIAIEALERAVHPPPPCACRVCAEARAAAEGERVWWMVLCSICNNKRCPHAAHHDNACTGSNEPGQPGSDYQ